MIIALLGRLQLLYQTERGQIPEVGLRLVTHSQSFLFRHDKHSRGAVSLKTHTNKQVTYSQCSLFVVAAFTLTQNQLKENLEHRQCFGVRCVYQEGGVGSGDCAVRFNEGRL